jgi:hypothetical protein
VRSAGSLNDLTGNLLCDLVHQSTVVVLILVRLRIFTFEVEPVVDKFLDA